MTFQAFEVRRAVCILLSQHPTLTVLPTPPDGRKQQTHKQTRNQTQGFLDLWMMDWYFLYHYFVLFSTNSITVWVDMELWRLAWVTNKNLSWPLHNGGAVETRSYACTTDLVAKRFHFHFESVNDSAISELNGTIMIMLSRTDSEWTWNLWRDIRKIYTVL